MARRRCQDPKRRREENRWVLPATSKPELYHESPEETLDVLVRILGSLVPRHQLTFRRPRSGSSGRIGSPKMST